MRRSHQILAALLVLVGMGPTAWSAELAAWFVPSATKVRQGISRHVNVGLSEMAAARNETEACQLVLRSEQAVAGVTVRVSDFRLADGSATLPVDVWKVAYVPDVAGRKTYPDPLPPLTPLDLEANQPQPVWISVRVPADAKPGTYAATVEVVAAGQRQEHPLRLKVWDFVLPVTPACTTAFGLHKPHIAQQHGVAVDSPQCQRLYEAYYEMLLDHRISAYSIPVDLMSEEAAKYLDDPRMTSFQIPYLDDDEALKKLVARLVERGWYAKGFFYPIDEPIKKESYAPLSKIHERLQRCAPGYQWVVPFFREPDWTKETTALDLLTGQINVWCPLTSYLDRQPMARSHLAARREQGERLWWYVCCIPGAPYGNFMVDTSAIAHRLLFWQQKREGIEGLLYWSATWWNPACIQSPWTDLDTIKDIMAGSLGEGSLFYPGKPVGVDGPVRSLRLEVIRDGLEDFDYLTLADAWLGREATQDYVAQVARSLTFYEQDPLVLENVRRALGDALEKNNPAARHTP